MSSARLALRTLALPGRQTVTSSEGLLSQVAHGHRALIASTLLARVATETLPFLKPWLVGRIIDALAAPSAHLPGPLIGGLFLLAVATGGATYLYGRSTARLGLSTAAAVRIELAQAWTARGLGGLSRGDALTRFSRDVDRLRAFTDRVYVRSLTGWTRACLPVAMLLAIEPTLALIALSVLPLQRVALARLERRMETAAHAASDAHARLFEVLNEALDGPPRIRGKAELLARAEALEVAELRSARLQAAIRGLVLLGTGVGLSLVWGFGAHLVRTGGLSLGGLVSFAGYVALAYRPFRQLAAASKTYRTGLASLDRIADAVARSRAQPSSRPGPFDHGLPPR